MKLNLLILIFSVFLLNVTKFTSGQVWSSPEDYNRLRHEHNENSNNISSNKDSSSEEQFFNPKSPYAGALEALFGIGVRLQLLLEEAHPNERNFLVSPLSMAVAVGELMLGARGKLRNYLADLLVIDGGNKISPNTTEDEIPLLNIHQQMGGLLRDLQHHGDVENTYILETASALFLQPDLKLKQLFERSIDGIYGTKILPVNFSTDPIGSFQYINNWASQNTRGRINQILPVPLPTTSAAVIANAVYFKADWENPFSVELSAVDSFHINPNKSVNVTFLRGQLDISYTDSKELNCTMIVLPYKDRKMSMYVVLPKVDNGNEYDIKKFTTKLRSKDLYDLMKLKRLRSVRVILPKINLSNTISILDPLMKYTNYKDILAKNSTKLRNRFSALNSRFDAIDEKIDTFKEVEKEHSNLSKPLDIAVGTEKGGIDLGGASSDPRFKLTDIIQQMSLAINEKGTEAAAVSSSTINLSGGVKDFFATRPFMFFIRHEVTEAILFWGTIVNPVT